MLWKGGSRFSFGYGRRVKPPQSKEGGGMSYGGMCNERGGLRIIALWEGGGVSNYFSFRYRGKWPTPQGGMSYEEACVTKGRVTNYFSDIEEAAWKGGMSYDGVCVMNGAGHELFSAIEENVRRSRPPMGRTGREYGIWGEGGKYELWKGLIKNFWYSRATTSRAIM